MLGVIAIRNSIHPRLQSPLRSVAAASIDQVLLHFRSNFLVKCSFNFDQNPQAPQLPSHSPLLQSSEQSAFGLQLLRLPYLRFSSLDMSEKQVVLKMAD